MKSVGKFLLILVCYAVLFIICLMALAFICHALMQIPLFQILLTAIISSLGWGDLYLLCTYLSCIITGICLYTLSERISALRQLHIFGIVLVIASVLFGILNFIAGEPYSTIFTNGAQAVLGLILTIATSK